MVEHVIVLWERSGNLRGEAGWVVLAREADRSYAWPLVALRQRGDEFAPELTTDLLKIAGAATVAAHTGEFLHPGAVEVHHGRSIDEQVTAASAADWISGMTSQEKSDIRRLHSAEQWRAAVRMAEPEATVSDVLFAIEKQLGPE